MQFYVFLQKKAAYDIFCFKKLMETISYAKLVFQFQTEIKSEKIETK